METGGSEKENEVYLIFDENSGSVIWRWTSDAIALICTVLVAQITTAVTRIS